jgi:LPXTG-motif cell wall-anchored protein
MTGDQWLLLAFVGIVLMMLGVLVFYRKSGNPIHILTALVLLVHTVTHHFLHMLWVIDPVAYPWVDTSSIWRTEVGGAIVAMAWLLFAVSVLTMREEYGGMALITGLSFLIWCILLLLDKVLGFVWPVALTDMMLYFRTIVGVIAFLFFLYATMKES